MQVITENLKTSKTPLYHKYPQQFTPQRAFIELDCREGGLLMADWSGEIGNAIPMYYYHKRAVRWAVSPEISRDSLMDILSDATFLALCETILAEYEDVYDGNNYVGRYSQEAEDAIEAAEKRIEELAEFIDVCDAGDYLFQSCVLRDLWWYESLDEAVSSIEAEIPDTALINGSIEDALLEQAEFNFESDRLDVTPQHVMELLKRGMISVDEAREWAADKCTAAMVFRCFTDHAEVMNAVTTLGIPVVQDHDEETVWGFFDGSQLRIAGQYIEIADAPKA